MSYTPHSGGNKIMDTQSGWNFLSSIAGDTPAFTATNVT